MSIQTIDVFYGLYRYRYQFKPVEKYKHRQDFQTLAHGLTLCMQNEAEEKKQIKAMGSRFLKLSRCLPM